MAQSEEQVKFGKLLVDLGRLQGGRIDRYMEKIGLYRGQAILLVVLSDREGLTHSEIADRLRISPAAATKVIKRLEELNYLQRQPDPLDERVSRVYLKEDGRAIIQEIKNIFRHADRELLSIFAPGEQQALIHYLQRIHDYLLKQVSETGEERVDATERLHLGDKR